MNSKVETTEVSATAVSSAPLLELENIRRNFGETIALAGVSLQVYPGTVHTVLGENGSGKSTLVKVLSGVLTPSSGRVLVAGEPLRPATPKRARQLGIATVFQEVLVAANRSVLENVLLGMDSPWRYAQRRAKRRELAQKALAQVSTFDFDLDQEVGQLGLVQQHQIAMARALLTEPKILVLDESTAALDIGERDHLFELIRSQRKAGLAIIFISHRMEEVLELSDQVSVLRSGTKVASLTRAEVSEARLLELLNPGSATSNPNEH